MTKSNIKALAMTQLALDNACGPSDFLRGDNTVVPYKVLDGRRLFRREGYFFKMTTFGHGAVISADASFISWCEDYFSRVRGIDCFEYPHLLDIDEALRPYGQKLCVNHEGYLPDYSFPRGGTDGLDVKWFFGEEIHALYGDTRFHNAILYDIKSDRPDTVAVASYENGEISGMAGCSADSADFWQIGIDVLPPFRGRGIGKTLVGALTDEIIRRGKVPYYGTWCSNIASRSIAQSCGFFPAWVEIYSELTDKV